MWQASSTLQALVLTAVNTGRRSFIGGVQVAGAVDIPLRVRWRDCRTLGETVADLQGHVVETIEPDIPRLIVGDGQRENIGAFAVRATFDGWCGGVVPLSDGRRLPERQECIPAGILAGALGVSEAFQFVRGVNSTAGRREQGLSLWRPDPEVSWLTVIDRGPLLERLPSRLWLIGLGHLGQAYLWTLGFLPYANPDDVELVLQDFDTLVKANDSTSLLTTLPDVGQKKTRAMAMWCTERGFRTVLQERRFADNFHVASDEPQVALCGVDNAFTRASLEDVGFSRIVEAGLGAGTQDLLAFQVHTFPASTSARTRWSRSNKAPATEALVELPAYRALADAGLNECGLTTLAGRTVGAPFVGAATAAVAISEILRMVLGEQRYEVIDANLRILDYRQVVQSNTDEPFNPGATAAMN